MSAAASPPGGAPRPDVGPGPARGEPRDEPPPGLPSWGAWYAVVLGELAVVILLFLLFTRATS